MFSWKTGFKLSLVLAVGIGLGYFIIKNIPAMNLGRKNIFNKIAGVKKPIVLGFAPYWLVNKDSPSYKNSLTDIAYFAVIVNSDGTILKLNDDKTEEPGWTKLKSQTLTDFRNKSKSLNHSIVIQSGVDESIQKLIANPEVNAKKMMAEIIPLMGKYKFIDLNLDIESLSVAEDQAQNNFTVFVKTVSEEMKKNRMGELSVEIPVAAFTRKTIINPSKIQPLVDYVILMAYDYKYRGSMSTGAVAPIGGAGVDKEIDVSTSINAALKSFRSEQLVLGIPLYGYEWETIDDKPGVAILPGSGLTATLDKMEDRLKECTNCQITSDETSGEKVVIYKDDKYGSYHQIYLPTEESLKQKIKMAKDLHLGGIAFWAMGYEDSSVLNSVTEYKDYWWKNK